MDSLNLNGRSLAIRLGITATLIGMLVSMRPAHAQSNPQLQSDTTATMERSMQFGARGPQQGYTPDAEKISLPDSNLMREMAKANLTRIQMSGLAMAISENEAVRSFAQQVLEGHGNAMKELRVLALSKGVILPGGIDKEPAAALRQLAFLRGDEFNRQYLEKATKNIHEQSFLLFEDVSKRTRDPDLKAYATKYLPLIQRHVEMGQQVYGSYAPAVAQTPSK